MVEIKKLPSGFWAVFVNGQWVDASQPSEAAARKFADGLRRYVKGVKK